MFPDVLAVNDLKALLLHHICSDKKPLFPSVKDIGVRISNLDETNYPGNGEVPANLLSLVWTGRRAASNALAQNLFEVVRLRCDPLPPSEQSAITNRLQLLLGESRVARDRDRPSARVSARLAEARLVWWFVQPPQSVAARDRDLLLRRLLECLDLVSGRSGIRSVSPHKDKTAFVVCVQDGDAAKAWLSYGLADEFATLFAAREDRQAHAQTLLRRIADLQSNNLLSCLEVGPLAASNLVLFDPQNQFLASGCHYYPAATESEGDVNILQLPPYALQSWRDTVERLELGLPDNKIDLVALSRSVLQEADPTSVGSVVAVTVID